ncbi:MAG: hypothetical protein AAF711_08250 [Planctomycetota bacterium]
MATEERQALVDMWEFFFTLVYEEGLPLLDQWTKLHYQTLHGLNDLNDATAEGTDLIRRTVEEYDWKTQIMRAQRELPSEPPKEWWQ